MNSNLHVLFAETLPRVRTVRQKRLLEAAISNGTHLGWEHGPTDVVSRTCAGYKRTGMRIFTRLVVGTSILERRCVNPSSSFSASRKAWTSKFGCDSDLVVENSKLKNWMQV